MIARLVDAHHHLWNLDSGAYPWLRTPKPPLEDDGLTLIRRNYEASDFLADTAGTPLVASVHVEAAHDPASPEAETAWVSSQAEHLGISTVVVAAARLQHPNLAATLDAHLEYPFVRGIRQMLNWLPDEPVAERDNLMDDETWLKGLSALDGRDLSFDLQVFPHQLHRAAQIVATHPGILFILDHGGYNQQRTAHRDALWASGLTELAALPNIAVKASGYASLDPSMNSTGLRWYLDVIITRFGAHRTMFASNFPVDSRFTTYRGLLDQYDEALKDLSADERDDFFFSAATAAYRISHTPTPNTPEGRR